MPVPFDNQQYLVIKQYLLNHTEKTPSQNWFHFYTPKFLICFEETSQFPFERISVFTPEFRIMEIYPHSLNFIDNIYKFKSGEIINECLTYISKHLLTLNLENQFIQKNEKNIIKKKI